MKRLILILALFSIKASLSGQDAAFLNDYLEKWKNSRAYTIECLELMPGDKYKFQASEDEMSFQKLSIHIINNMVWLSGDYLDAPKFQNDLKSIDPNKEELIEIMKAAYDHAATAVKNTAPHQLNLKVDFFAGEMNLRKIIELMDDHATHHRAQLAVYLRLNGIKPPRYRGW